MGTRRGYTRVPIPHERGDLAIEEAHEDAAPIIGLPVFLAPQINEKRIVFVGLALGGEVGFGLRGLLIGVRRDLFGRLDG